MMSWFLAGVAALHLFFMIAELFPWQQPVLLRLVSKKLPDGERFTTVQQRLVATIVHNAGIYNGIVAGGLLWAAFGGKSAADVAHVMLWGAAVAGVFGTVTLKSPMTAAQAVAGIVGLVCI
jgi:uncharacterized membrane protein